jgi:hypothetical protein
VKRKKLYARMRTLLNESLPPHFNEETPFSQPQKIQATRRIFSENAVLSTSEPNLVEVGVDGAATATAGAGADSALNAPARGLAALRPDTEQLKESPAL